MAKHLTIRGVVQGVGYRASFDAQARALQLSGWVRNRADGSVEAVVEGNADAVNQIIAWAHQGPRHARVDKLTVSDINDESIAPGAFAIRPTA